MTPPTRRLIFPRRKRYLFLHVWTTAKCILGVRKLCSDFQRHHILSKQSIHKINVWYLRPYIRNVPISICLHYNRYDMADPLTWNIVMIKRQGNISHHVTMAILGVGSTEQQPLLCSAQKRIDFTGEQWAGGVFYRPFFLKNIHVQHLETTVWSRAVYIPLLDKMQSDAFAFWCVADGKVLNLLQKGLPMTSLSESELLSYIQKHSAERQLCANLSPYPLPR